MTAQNNAARVAVKAKPCQKQARGLSAVPLPTVPQAMRMACAVVVESLSAAIETACATGQWRNEYQDGIHAAEVALDVVERLEAEMPSDFGTFDMHWFRTTSILRLVRDAFTDEKAPASLAFQTAVRDLEALHRVVSFLDLKAEQERSAA